MKRTIRTLGWRFSADRMVMDYTRNCYIPAAGGTSNEMKPPAERARGSSRGRNKLSSQPERTRISYFRTASHDHVCGSPQREPHAIHQRHGSRQEIRGSAVEGPAVCSPTQSLDFVRANPLVPAPDFSPGERVLKSAGTFGIQKIGALALVAASQAVCIFFRSARCISMSKREGNREKASVYSSSSPQRLYTRKTKAYGKATTANGVTFPRELIGLAEATPADKFSWRPAPGVRSTSEVYMHIAIANFYLLSVTSTKLT